VSGVHAQSRAQSRARGRSDRLRWSVDQWALRAVVLVASPLAVVCAAAAGAAGFAWAVLLVLPVSVAAAIRPDSHWPALAMSVGGSYWLLSAPRQLTGWSLLAAALLLVCHCAASLAALGPPGMRLDRTTLRTWSRRLAVLLAAVILTWGVASLVTRASGSSSVLLTVLAFVVLAALAAALDG
jgi:hypothetical protein